MDIENFEKLKEMLYRKGFGESLYDKLEQQMKSGKPEFTIEHLVSVDKDDVGYRLHFRRDEERDKVYFNKFEAQLIKNADAPNEAVRQHTFPSEKLITALEAYRMLKYGDQVAVNKDLFNREGQKYNTWISIDIKGPKDEYNNYPVNTYHENYYAKQPFELKDALKNLPVPVKELENPQVLENIEKALKKANLVSVTIMVDGEQMAGKLAVNPASGRIDVYDKNMQLVEPKQQQEQSQSSQKSSAVEIQENEKKSPRING